MIQNRIAILKFLTKDNLLCLFSRIWIIVFIGMRKQLFWLSHCLTRLLTWSYFLPQKIVMHHLQLILHFMLNHQISRLCILEKAIVQV